MHKKIKAHAKHVTKHAKHVTKHVWKHLHKHKERYMFGGLLVWAFLHAIQWMALKVFFAKVVISFLVSAGLYSYIADASAFFWWPLEENLISNTTIEKMLPETWWPEAENLTNGMTIEKKLPETWWPEAENLTNDKKTKK